MRSKFDTTEPMPIGNQKHLEHNRIMKILGKAKHAIEIILPKDYPAYLRKRRLTELKEKQS